MRLRKVRSRRDSGENSLGVASKSVVFTSTIPGAVSDDDMDVHEECRDVLQEVQGVPLGDFGGR